MTKREARAKRNREDAIRITQQAVPKEFKQQVGHTWGPTFHEKLEAELKRHVELMREQRDAGKIDIAKQTRAIIRGLAKALAMYERFYQNLETTYKDVEAEFLAKP
jgi:hypothetical protein